jgi:hypothetical protein
MKTVYIMVEGQTEEEFVNSVLSHYLKSYGIMNTVPIPLETSPGFYGGDISYLRYRRNALNLLVADPNSIVTSLIDYYELRQDFPGYEAAALLLNKNNSVEYIEREVATEIGNENLIPYIQLHEFEGLLFSDIRGFQYIPRAHIGRAQYVINHNPNPELINDSKDTAPSIRLKTIIPRYQKPFHGPIIAIENGMIPLLSKCPRFKWWIEVIIEKASH